MSHKLCRGFRRLVAGVKTIGHGICQIIRTEFGNKAVGADRFIPKFSPDDLANAVTNGLDARNKPSKSAA